MKMQHPNFITQERIAEICSWPPSDRRQLTNSLPLCDSDGRPVNFRDEREFWKALLNYLLQGPLAYKKILEIMAGISAKALQRAIHMKILKKLIIACPEFKDWLKDQSEEFLIACCKQACDGEAIKEIADWLWAYWLHGCKRDLINKVIEEEPKLAARFGAWRAPVIEDMEEGKERESEAELGKSKSFDADSILEDCGYKFAQLREQLKNAEETGSKDALLIAKNIIDELIKSIDESSVKKAADIEMLHELILQVKSREELADSTAAARRTKAVEMALCIHTLPSINADSIVININNAINRAETEMQNFRRAEEAHLEAKFDRKKLKAYNEALARYADAENEITEILEEIASEAVTSDGLSASSKAIESSQHEDSIRSDESESVKKKAKDASSVLMCQTSDSEQEGQIKITASQGLDEINEQAQGIDFPNKTKNIAPSLLGRIEAETAGSPDPSETKPENNATDLVSRENLVIKNKQNEGPDSTAQTLAECFLRRGNLGLFMLACEFGKKLEYDLPSPNIPFAVGTSGLTDPIWQPQYSDAVKSLLNNGDLERRKPSESCLLFAAFCLPAILDPTYISRNALNQLKLEHGDFSAAIDLRRTIDALGRTYSGLQEFLPDGSTDPEMEFRKALTVVKEAITVLKNKTLKYHPATVVAHRLAHEIEQAIDGPVKNIDVFNSTFVKKNPFNQNQNDDQIIRRLDREVRKEKANHFPIESSALKQLGKIIEELSEKTQQLHLTLAILREHQKAKGQSREGAHRKGLELQSRFKVTAEQFRHLAKELKPEESFVEACMQVAATLLDAHASAIETGRVTNPFHDSLELDRYRLSSSARDPNAPETGWAALKEIASKPAKTWIDAFDEAVERSEHLASQRLLRVAQPIESMRKLESERAEAIAEAREKLSQQCRQIKEELVTVMNYAPPAETSLDPLYQSLNLIDEKLLPIDHDPGHVITERVVLDFSDAFSEINKAKSRIQEVKNIALRKLENRIQEQENHVSSTTISHLRDLFKSEDLITLSEELSLVERGQDIGITPSGPKVIEEFSKFIELNTEENLAEWVRKQVQQSPRAVTLVRKWQNVKNSVADPRRGIRDLFGELGFEPKGEVETIGGSASKTRVRHYRIRTKLIADREFCSVSRFGSEAEGQYQLILTDKDAKPNEIVTAVPEFDAGATVIIIPRWLNKDTRLQIAQEARRLHRTFCLIDDALIAFICDRNRIIRDLFACGIPFSAGVPYVITPGSIPAEMFFGREDEIKKIKDRDGGCIIYGGRQLGKSVLLDQIEHKNEKNQDNIAVRIDCQDVTERREIFAHIEKKISLKTGIKHSNIIDTIETWLQQKPERTVLLMLDETNMFVRADADRNFDVLIEFRGLMERTKRRFKIVLSGQNNVLRLTQTPNTPLAHFGQPICIGPLKGSDYKAARSLVEEPLAAVGYTFADDRLISRILVETQFYPKLIQMVCRDLLSHVRTVTNVHSELPPWKINLQHIEATLRNQTLSKDIFNTFKITLDLDKRYELIALIMAYERSEQRKNGGIGVGMSERELRDQALSWWKGSFSTLNVREEFEGLVEELEGLGILIKDLSKHTLQLASPVIANLMGSEEEIYDRLLSFTELPPVTEIEPSKRRAVEYLEQQKEKGGGTWLQPLNPLQVSRIVRARWHSENVNKGRTFVVYGSPDMRLDRIAHALQPQKYDEHVGISLAVLNNINAINEFTKQLASTVKQTFFVVPPSIPWNSAWVEAAKRSTREHITVFIGNLGTAWSHIVEDHRGIHRIEGIQFETVAPLSIIEIDDQIRRRHPRIKQRISAAIEADTGGYLNPFGEWTAQLKKIENNTKGEIENPEQKIKGCNPRFETLPAAGRDIIRSLTEYTQPHDALNSEDLGGFSKKPHRVFEWLLRAGLAEVAAEKRDHLRLNKVFWTEEIRKLLNVT